MNCGFSLTSINLAEILKSRHRKENDIPQLHQLLSLETQKKIIKTKRSWAHKTPHGDFWGIHHPKNPIVFATASPSTECNSWTHTASALVVGPFLLKNVELDRFPK